MNDIAEIQAAHPGVSFEYLTILDGRPAQRNECVALQAIRWGKPGVDEWIAESITELIAPGLIPTTWLISRIVDNQPQSGSRQLYAPHPRASQVPDLVDRLHTPDGIAEIAKLIAIDVLICNTDRHEDNWLLTPANSIIAIDNTVGETMDDLHAFSIWDYCRPAARLNLLEDRTHLPLLRDAVVDLLICSRRRLLPGTTDRIRRQFAARLATLSRRHQYGCPLEAGGVPLIRIDLEAEY